MTKTSIYAEHTVSCTSLKTIINLGLTWQGIIHLPADDQRDLPPKPRVAQAASCSTQASDAHPAPRSSAAPTTAGLNWLEKLGYTISTVKMITVLKTFQKKKIWQTIQIKIRSFLRSNGVFSRGTGSSGRTWRAGKGRRRGQIRLISKGSSALHNKTEWLGGN